MKGILIIGERINSSRKPIAEAISRKDKTWIQKEARAQAEAGADYLDLNAGTFLGEEEEGLKWLVDTVQEATDLPLCIDSADAKIVRSVLPLVGARPMINSFSLEPERLEGILPLAVQYKARLIGLCQSEEAMAETAEAKVEMAAKLVEAAAREGLHKEDLYIDPLVFPLAANANAARATLSAIEQIRKSHEGVHVTCGLTNISYGLPKRRLVNRVFLVSAISRGLDCVIMDPTDAELYASLRAAVMVAGCDDFCMEYIRAFRQGRLG